MPARTPVASRSGATAPTVILTDKCAVIGSLGSPASPLKFLEGRRFGQFASPRRRVPVPKEHISHKTLPFASNADCSRATPAMERRPSNPDAGPAFVAIAEGLVTTTAHYHAAVLEQVDAVCGALPRQILFDRHDDQAVAGVELANVGEDVLDRGRREAQRRDRAGFKDRVAIVSL